MTLAGSRLFQIFKYAVYVLLTMNIYWFFVDEHAAAKLQFADGLALADLIEAYAATIDTTAWVVLLLMFELETYVLEDQRTNSALDVSLQGLRAVCYAFIVYAFYGYIVNLTALDATTPLEFADSLCDLAGSSWTYAAGLDEFVAITADNCMTFSSSQSFLQIGNLPAVADSDQLRKIRNLAWVDVINAGVWLLVVIVLEFDVQLQERKKLEGAPLKVSNALKVGLYTTLLLAAVYWGINGDFVDFWDAFLWLVAFVFIELNVFEWRQESVGHAYD